MAKGRILRALLRMKHSPAGKRYLKSKKGKKDTKPTYFKGKRFERPTVEAQLKEAGLSEEMINRFKGKK